jgi:hypothetical protein
VLGPPSFRSGAFPAEIPGDRGIRPFSGFAGTVAVKDDVQIFVEFRLRRVDYPRGP